jgi:NADH:ubiquinone oxidoreductase subunit F (NADH-binding)
VVAHRGRRTWAPAAHGGRRTRAATTRGTVVAARGTLAGDAYIYIHGGYILNIRSDVVEAAQTSSTQKKNLKNRKSG